MPLCSESMLVDAQGKVAAQQEQSVTVGPASVEERTANVAVPHPHLWQGVEDPYLYRLVVELSNKSSQAGGSCLCSVRHSAGSVRSESMGCFSTENTWRCTASATTRIVKARAGRGTGGRCRGRGDDA